MKSFKNALENPDVPMERDVKVAVRYGPYRTGGEMVQFPTMSVVVEPRYVFPAEGPAVGLVKSSTVQTLQIGEVVPDTLDEKKFTDEMVGGPMS